MNKENKKVGNRLYFMNDKNIRDGLVAQRVKAEHIASILLDKGIVVSQSSSKDELLDIVQKVRFDFYDYIQLCTLLENRDRRDSLSTTEIPEKCTKGNITKAFNEVKKVMSDDEVSLNLTSSSSTKFNIEANYVDIDYSKAPMRQRTRKKGTIEIEVNKSTGETSIRFPATDVGKLVKSKLVNAISKQLETTVIPIEIDYEHATTKERTEFFTRLIQLDNYEVYDVVNVNVKNIGTNKDETESDFTGQVRKAVLSGQELLASKIYDSFPSDKYHIYKIVWKVRELQPNIGADQSDCYTVEAQFDNSDKSKGFRYQVKTVQRYSRGSLNVTPSNQIEKNEAEKLSKLIYKTAVSIYTDMMQSKD
ncbi:hypothetical protein GKA70_18880 [Vibrio parahaemolyticus]|nr:hypothetical protein [Vibrio parahaemolyticus]ELI3522919.1 hypothetical protein [Vibrio vulnificus]CDU09294.1 hypothetical protein VDIAB_270101 [Vibrio diabolicus]HCZ9306558.1 hypothetical protein [Vibrio alginolyticus]EGU8228519.1 hypothetical protein [Vibrio parahaemolyticus]